MHWLKCGLFSNKTPETNQFKGKKQDKRRDFNFYFYVDFCVQHPWIQNSRSAGCTISTDYEKTVKSNIHQSKQNKYTIYTIRLRYICIHYDLKYGICILLFDFCYLKKKVHFFLVCFYNLKTSNYLAEIRLLIWLENIKVWNINKFVSEWSLLTLL